MKIAILTYIESKDHYDTIRNGLLSKKNYCDKHGYDLVFNSKYKDDLTKAKWDCIHYLLQFLNGEIIPDDDIHYDYILFSSPHSMITNMDFNLEEMIKSRMNSEKHILVSSMIQPAVRDTDEVFKSGKITTNNIILKNTQTTKKIINRFYEQRFLQNPNLSIEEVFNEFMNHHLDNSIVKYDIQVINNPHLFNSISDSSLNGWLSGDFILHVNKPDNVKNIFRMFGSIVNLQNISLENNVYKTVLQFTQKSSLHFEKYLNFIEKSITSIIPFTSKKGEWFSLEKNVIAVLYVNDEYWTFIKTD